MPEEPLKRLNIDGVSNRVCIFNLSSFRILITDTYGSSGGWCWMDIFDHSNKLVYRLYESSLPTTALQLDYFCGNTTPVLPVIKEEWVATSGDIELSTTTSGGILHTIRLKNVTFKRGNSSFYYGDDMLYGELLLPE